MHLAYGESSPFIFHGLVNQLHSSFLFFQILSFIFFVSPTKSFFFSCHQRGNLIIASIYPLMSFIWHFYFDVLDPFLGLKSKFEFICWSKFSLLLCSWLTFWGLISWSCWGIIILSCLYHFYSLPIPSFIIYLLLLGFDLIFIIYLSRSNLVKLGHISHLNGYSVIFTSDSNSEFAPIVLISISILRGQT